MEHEDHVPNGSSHSTNGKQCETRAVCELYDILGPQGSGSLQNMECCCKSLCRYGALDIKFEVSTNFAHFIGLYVAWVEMEIQNKQTDPSTEVNSCNWVPPVKSDWKAVGQANPTRLAKFSTEQWKPTKLIKGPFQEKNGQIVFGWTVWSSCFCNRHIQRCNCPCILDSFGSEREFFEEELACRCITAFIGLSAVQTARWRAVQSLRNFHDFLLRSSYRKRRAKSRGYWPERQRSLLVNARCTFCVD